MRFAKRRRMESPNENRDPLFDQAVEFVRSTGRATISAVQRHLRVGYTRSARIIDQMEAEGVVSPYSPGKPREVLLDLSPEDEEGSEEDREDDIPESVSFKGPRRRLVRKRVRELSDRAVKTLAIWLVASVLFMLFAGDGWFVRLTQAPVLGLAFAVPALLWHTAVFALPEIPPRRRAVFLEIFFGTAAALLGGTCVWVAAMWPVHEWLASLVGALYEPSCVRLLPKAFLLTFASLLLLAVQAQTAVSFFRESSPGSESAGATSVLLRFPQEIGGWLYCLGTPWSKVEPDAVELVRRWGLRAVTVTCALSVGLLIILPPVIPMLALPIMGLALAAMAEEIYRDLLDNKRRTHDDKNGEGCSDGTEHAAKQKKRRSRKQ